MAQQIDLCTLIPQHTVFRYLIAYISNYSENLALEKETRRLLNNTLENLMFCTMQIEGMRNNVYNQERFEDAELRTMRALIQFKKNFTDLLNDYFKSFKNLDLYNVPKKLEWQVLHDLDSLCIYATVQTYLDEKNEL